MRNLFLPLLASGLLLAGCGGSQSDGDIVLATVGDRTITVEDFKSYYQDIPGVDRPGLDSLEGKKDFLDDLINKDIMEIASYDALPELTEQQGWRMERFRKSTLTKIFKNKLVRYKVKVTEADIDTAYEHLQRDVFLDGILLPEGPMAKEMKRRLDQGANFEDVCRDYSIWESENPDAPWEIGWSSAGQLTNWDMEVAAWAASPGDILGAYREARGWWVLRVGESRSIPVDGTKESMRPKLQYMVEKPRHLDRGKVVLDSLMALADVQYPQEGQLLLLEKFAWEPPPELVGDPMAQYTVARAIPIVGSEEGVFPAVVFKDGTVWDIQEFLDRASWYASGIWPTGASVEELTKFMVLVIRDDAYVRAAIDLGLETDPEFIETYTGREKKLRVNYLYHSVVVGPVEPTQEEIMEWFQTHRDRYQAPAGFRMAFFSSSDRALMQELREAWVEGAGFTELRDNYDSRVEDLIYVGDSSWLNEGDDPGIDGHLAGLESGQVASLFGRNDQTFVIRLLDRRGQRLVTYAEAKDLIDKDAVTNARDQALKNFLEDYRERLGVTVDEEALGRLVINPADFPVEEESTQ